MHLGTSIMSAVLTCFLEQEKLMCSRMSDIHRLPLFPYIHARLPLRKRRVRTRRLTPSPIEDRDAARIDPLALQMITFETATMTASEELSRVLI